MAKCTDCAHFDLCDYNTNIAGDSKIKLFYDKGAEKCSFYKPRFDVAEVKHGSWKLNKDGSGTCDQCKKTQKNVWDYDNWQNYCGCCGAKMDGKKRAKIIW